MNKLIENNQIKEISYKTNFAYVLNDDCTFLPTEYKVLHAQSNNVFLKCMKTYYNGKVQLFYLTENRASLQSLLPKLDPDSFLTLVSNLLVTVIEVQGNGFLSSTNIDLSFDHIYIDPSTLKVSLVYIPVGTHLFNDNASFENRLRVELIKIISESPQLISQRTTQLKRDLQNGSMTIQDIANSLSGYKDMNFDYLRRKSLNDSPLKLVSLNSRINMEITITKPEYVIGRKASAVDGVIAFNKMIGRIHCRITKNQNTYFIEDLQSVNGTYVNRKKLMPFSPVPIKSDDIISLANSDFQVII